MAALFFNGLKESVTLLGQMLLLAKLGGNKAKGWITKRVLQENKARQKFTKKETVLIPWYAYVRVRSKG